LLMSRDLRAQWTARLPVEAMAVTPLPSIRREYSLVEIATMTRAAPARLLGLRDRGHLAAGALADVAVYENEPDRAKMFRSAALVFKQGALVVRDGKPTQHIFGRALMVEPERDRAIDRRVNAYYGERYGISGDLIKVPDHAIGTPEPFELIPCAR
jgi:formylmethanofuran dehydrogenase subunit A